MEYITLKNSDLKVSRLCMGGCPMGGYGWGITQEQDFIDAVNTAIDYGINFFDTADTYGLGQSEKTLAKGLGNNRKNVIIESKFGVKAGHGQTVYDNSPAYIREALESTLKRLNTTWVDIYTIHYRDGITPIADVVDTLLSLRQEGKIRYFGLSNVKADEMPELSKYKDQFVNTQEEFSLACRRNETSLITASSELGITPMTWGSLGQGILTGKYDRNCRFESNDRRSRDIYVNFHGEKLEQNLRIVDCLKGIAAQHKKSVAACAIRFILDYVKDSVVLAGAKNPKQIISNVEALDWHLTEGEIKKLNELSIG